MTEPTAAPTDEPIKFSSSLLPGDAMAGPDDESEDSQEQEVLPPPVPNPPPPATEAQIVILTSTSADGLRSRDFALKYWKPVTHDAPLRAALDLPESYFSPTASELQTAFAGQVKKREQLVDAPLLTRKLREKEELEKSRIKANRWPQTRIRVRFSDRSQLEGVLPSTDKLIAIYEFVKLALAPEHRATPFVLYQTPPRREFVKGDPQYKGKTMMDLQFTPSSVFYIKFAEETLNEMQPPPLLPELLAAAADFPLPPAFDPTASTPTPTPAEPKSKSQKLGFGGSSGKVTPSWLKLGKTGKK